MVDFFGSFLVLAALVVLLIAVCSIYFITKIIIRITDGEKRKASEQLIQKNAEIMLQYIEEKNINSTEEMLKLIVLPKKMTIIKEDNNFFIKYNNLTYNVNTGRFKLDIV